jgi:hypothetical protein
MGKYLFFLKNRRERESSDRKISLSLTQNKEELEIGREGGERREERW